MERIARQCARIQADLNQNIAPMANMLQTQTTQQEA